MPKNKNDLLQIAYPEGFQPFISEILLRNDYVRDIGFALLLSDWVKPLSKYLKNKNTLEVMAGKGGLAKVLRDMDVKNYIATDDFSWVKSHEISTDWETTFTEVIPLDAIKSIETYGKDIDHLIISWSPYADDIAYSCAKTLRRVNFDATIIYIGELEGGCCASDNFFDIVTEVEIKDKELIKAHENYSVNSWSGIHDTLILLKNI